MITLTQPHYLWALLALAVPIGIHLLSRKEGRVIPVGSLRHLQETTSQQFRGIKLNELVQLALRLLLIFLFVLLLAGFAWNNSERSKWVLFDASLSNNKEAIAFADSLEAQGYSWHWLANGFPEKDQAPESGNTWILLAELSAKLLSEVVIVSPGRLNEFNGSYQSLPAHVSWQTFELPEKKFAVYATNQNNVTVMRSGISTPSQTQFMADTVTVVPDSVMKLDPTRVALVADAGFETKARLVEAALTAIQKTLPVVISKNNESPDWLIWFSDNPVPATNANVITSTHSKELIEQTAPSQWTIGELTIDKALQENFTVQLASLLISNSDVQSIVDENDNRSISSQQLTNTVQASAGVHSESAMSLPLLILFLVSLIAERIVAFIRRQ